MLDILIVFALVAIMAFGYVKMSSTVATGASGGVTDPSNSADAAHPDLTVPTSNGTALVSSSSSPTIPYTTTAVVPPVLPKLVKFIRLSKSMVDEPVADFRSLQIAEVKAFTGAGQLGRTAFSDVSYVVGLGKQAAGQAAYPAEYAVDGNLNTFTETTGTETAGSIPIHSLTLTLKDPSRIERLEIYNRTNFMHERLGGTYVTLLAEDGSTIWTSEKLSTAATVQVVNPQYSEGFTSLRKLFRM